MHGGHTRYRPDIDGLRSVAVIPILLFHAGLSQLQGGFVGVDIFFVISGYLITRIILREIDEDRFSIASFYRRRIIRIFPALFVMICFVIIFACSGIVTMFPAELRGLSAGIAATVGFASNIYFYDSADYFATISESQILLHTWSLGVEEQFYLFYPLILLLIRRRANKFLRPLVLLGTALSLILSVWISYKQPAFAFYMLPTRAWELGLGAIAALELLPSIESDKWRNLLGISGISFIGLGIFFIRSGPGFPAPWAMLPCIGAALVIGYGELGIVGQLLALRPFRFVGGISYSLYLWHWPIVAFYRLWKGTPLSLPDTALLILLSLGAAMLSYYVVEQPFLRRFRHIRPSAALVAGGGAIAVSLATCVGLYVAADSIPRISPRVRAVGSYLDYRNTSDFQKQFRVGHCFIYQGQQLDDWLCLHPDPSRRNVVVLGDSHAGQYARAIAERFPNMNVMQATADGCRPVLHGAGAPSCVALMNRIMTRVVNSGEVQDIVLAGRWQPQDLPLLANTLNDLKRRGMSVTLLGPGEEYQQEFPALLGRALVRKGTWTVASEEIPGLKAQSDAIGDIAHNAGVSYLPVYDIQCPISHRCELLDKFGQPVLFDFHHVTLAEARQVIAHLNLK
jgi:peptidoglycan/LPS O-acetylase OafA/YrhL